MKEKRYYAHTKQDPDHRPLGEEEWQLLEDHLREVAALAGDFAAVFGAEEWGSAAGMAHDLGKYGEGFQEYLRRAQDLQAAEIKGKVDHSTAGAQYLVKKYPCFTGHLAAYTVAGHHSGLLDGLSEGGCQEKRLGKKIDAWEHGLGEVAFGENLPLFPFLTKAFGGKQGFPVSFFIRMIFSCLVDADFLNTENFLKPEHSLLRPQWPQDILTQMEDALTKHIRELPQRNKADNVVSSARTRVREDCLKAALEKPGFFSLTVPTGGGKTLSSLAFALAHGRQFDLKRVVYVIPFTSIIKQNANVFKEAMASLVDFNVEDLVVEHHSNIDPDKETTKTRLMTENWDAPLIVTTAVQFYESLFAARTSSCRKLHNLAKAVIILDEAQTIPVEFLEPCLKALEELVLNYGCTVVWCTATQPAVGRRKDFPIGIEKEKIREIIQNPIQLYQSLKRVSLVNLNIQTDQEILRKIQKESSVLCIVNTRGHAQILFESLEDREGDFHLSALMCPVHRIQILEIIRKRLEEKLPCRVISTQLIEAGVDIDFPVVFRSTAGLDSLAQAAGRCNRNGNLKEKGTVYIFQSEHLVKEKFLSHATESGRQIIECHPEDPLSLEGIDHFFRLYYWTRSEGWDKKNILENFRLVGTDANFPFHMDFAKTGKDFKFIENNYRPLIIPWGKEGEELYEKLRRQPFPPRGLRRKLQGYTVQIPERAWYKAEREGLFDLVHDAFPVLISPNIHYSEKLGLHLDEEEQAAFYL